MGKECSVVATSPPSPAEVLALDFSEPRPRCPLFRHWPSTLSDVTCPPLQQDPYEKGRVEVRGSEIGGAGDGLFATRDLAAGETASFYNGIRVSPGQTPPFKTFSYEIFVEWVSNGPLVRSTATLFFCSLIFRGKSFPTIFMTATRIRLHGHSSSLRERRELSRNSRA